MRSSSPNAYDRIGLSSIKRMRRATVTFREPAAPPVVPAAGTAVRRGKRTVNLHPWPVPPLVAVTVPPCSCARRSTSVSPSPKATVGAVAACANLLEGFKDAPELIVRNADACVTDTDVHVFPIGAEV